MQNVTTPTPLEIAETASAELSGVKQRITSLQAEKSTLLPDPEKSIQAEVSRVIDEGNRIDAELAKLEASIAIYNERMLGIWQAAEASLRPELTAALADAHALVLECDKSASRLYTALTPDGNNSLVFSPGFIPRDTFGVKRARDLYDDIYSKMNPWRGGDLPGLMAIVRAQADLLPTVPGCLVAIRSDLAKLSAAADDIANRFAASVESVTPKSSPRAAKRAEDEPS